MYDIVGPPLKEKKANNKHNHRTFTTTRLASFMNARDGSIVAPKTKKKKQKVVGLVPL
jgi:hypothetical protein